VTSTWPAVRSGALDPCQASIFASPSDVFRANKGAKWQNAHRAISQKDKQSSSILEQFMTARRLVKAGCDSLPGPQQLIQVLRPHTNPVHASHPVHARAPKPGSSSSPLRQRCSRRGCQPSQPWHRARQAACAIQLAHLLVWVWTAAHRWGHRSGHTWPDQGTRQRAAPMSLLNNTSARARSPRRNHFWASCLKVLVCLAMRGGHQGS
jgi:hypothetical protein